MTEDSKKEEDLESLKEFVKKNYWKVRECKDYELEYSQCASLKGRFHQYFVFGEFLDCSKWKEDAKNCLDCVEDVKKCASIIRHEDERLEKRMKNHLANDVWERRSKPPENWNTELPDWMKERQEVFAIIKENENEKENKFCIIS